MQREKLMGTYFVRLSREDIALIFPKSEQFVVNWFKIVALQHLLVVCQHRIYFKSYQMLTKSLFLVAPNLYAFL